MSNSDAPVPFQNAPI